MRRLVPLTTGIATLLFGLAVALPSHASARQEGPPAPPDPPKPTVIPEASEDPMKLIREIEEKMIDAERILAKATAKTEGDRAMQTVIEKLEELLKSADARQQEILDALKKLEDQAVPMPSGGGGSGDREQPDPKEREQREQRQREDKENRSLQKLDPGNSKPNSGKESERKTQTTGKTKPPDSDRKKADLARQFERWGNLPKKLREQIEQGNYQMFPPQYRDLLERFYKRLSDSETSDSH